MLGDKSATKCAGAPRRLTFHDVASVGIAAENGTRSNNRHMGARERRIEKVGKKERGVAVIQSVLL